MSEPAVKQRRKKRKEANPLPWVLLVVALIVGAIWFVARGSGSSHRSAAPEETMTIELAPPPPPPPPPPKVEPPPPKEEIPPEEEEMMVQEPVPEDEPAPDDSPPEPPPGPDLGPGSAGGTGPAIGGGGGGRIGGGNGRRGPTSKFGWYAAKVQSTIREALAGNPATRSATFSGLTVKIWADSSGRITRAQLIGTSGNAAVDQAIKNRILTGLQLPQAPPSDMRMPINLRISARKPVSS